MYVWTLVVFIPGPVYNRVGTSIVVISVIGFQSSVGSQVTAYSPFVLHQVGRCAT